MKNKEKVIEFLNKAWNSNATKMEYMIIGDVELDRLLKVNEYITDALKILNEPNECEPVHCNEQANEVSHIDCVYRFNDEVCLQCIGGSKFAKRETD